MLMLQKLVVTVAALCAFTICHAQIGKPWRLSPSVVAISAHEDDVRFAVVEDAVAYWNSLLADQGSAFRLGPVSRLVRPLPEEDVKGFPMSNYRVYPDAFLGLPGDLRVLLSDGAFISYAANFDVNHRRVIGIRNMEDPVMGKPNVLANLVIHEVGHAIGLGHNDTTGTLMCGRPARCRPNDYEAETPRIFPLMPAEMDLLRALYPPEWKASLDPAR
ncbi:MAG: hypothetical protein EOO27_45480 [Comamonadaceae bacterium]|nr:MAG: hypothetical protein EOO27_45480 [Comamonadaceae bacterium]